jgi:peptidoglycan LD-endopeptidase LytH
MMEIRQRRSTASAAAPWVVATTLVAGAWIAAHGIARVAPARSATADPVTTRATPPPRVTPSAPVTAAATENPEPALSPLPPGSEDVAELRRRRLPIPVEGVHAAVLVSTFHQSRDGREHEALDILAPRGTAVIAVENGRVAKLYTSVRGGLTIYLFDPSGVYCYYYAHLDHYAAGLHDGQDVARGETIGYVGTTGNAPPNTPHLHFAVFKLGPEKHWWQGTPIDPYLLWR